VSGIMPPGPRAPGGPVAEAGGPSAAHGERGRVKAPFTWLAEQDRNWRTAKGTAPFPLVRWALALGILAWCATFRNPSLAAWASVHGPWLILAALLAIGPEITGLAVGGLKLSLLRETKAEVAQVRDAVTRIQVQQAQSNVINLILEGREAFRGVTEGAENKPSAATGRPGHISELVEGLASR
jgi:hypothetical protein